MLSFHNFQIMQWDLYLPFGCASLTACRISTNKFCDIDAAALELRFTSEKSSLESLLDDPSPSLRLWKIIRIEHQSVYTEH